MWEKHKPSNRSPSPIEQNDKQNRGTGVAKQKQSQRHRGKADLREADGARVWKGGRGDTGRGMARTSKASGPLMQVLGS